MKKKLYTIPLNDALDAQDECPFCYIERDIEQHLLDFVLGNGSSYMEENIRSITDETGFCRTHFKKMFDYGNTLGNAWILKTHYMQMIKEMKKEFHAFKPFDKPLKKRVRKNAGSTNPIGIWAMEKTESCYICNQYKETYERYIDTFFYLYKQDSKFRKKLKTGKGFCIPHLGDLCSAADEKLTKEELKKFYSTTLPLMEANMDRIFEDVAWMIEKFDYINKDADWKNSRDAIQRGMQKLKGGYPADPVYKMSK